MKQGGVLSGSLFTYYINDLIDECCQSGFGAIFLNLIITIISFCDDICLLSPNAPELIYFLNICDNYSKKWAIEFNVTKCNYIVFGSNKHNNCSFLLNNLALSYSNNIKYLGLELNNNLDFSKFFI